MLNLEGGFLTASLSHSVTALNYGLQKTLRLSSTESPLQSFWQLYQHHQDRKLSSYHIDWMYLKRGKTGACRLAARVEWLENIIVWIKARWCTNRVIISSKPSFNSMCLRVSTRQREKVNQGGVAAELFLGSQVSRSLMHVGYSTRYFAMDEACAGAK